MEPGHQRQHQKVRLCIGEEIPHTQQDQRITQHRLLAAKTLCDSFTPTLRQVRSAFYQTKVISNLGFRPTSPTQPKSQPRPSPASTCSVDSRLLQTAKRMVLRSQNRTRDLSITMKLLQSNVINQLHQAEECNQGCACVNGHVMNFRIYICVIQRQWKAGRLRLRMEDGKTDSGCLC